jgi:nucleolar protein 12
MLPRALRVSRCKAPHKTARAMEAKHGKAAPHSGKGKGKADKSNGYVPKATAEDKTLAGRASKLLGRSAAFQMGGKKKKWDKAHAGARRRESGGAGATEPETKTMKSPEDIVFEGRRASVKDGRPKDLKFKGGGGKHKKKGGPKSGGRGAIRAAQWRAGGAAK